MSNKVELLDSVKRSIRTQYEMPEITVKGIQYPDKIAQFKGMLSSVGGEAIELQSGESVNDLIRSHYPEAETIASNIADVAIATINPDQTGTAHELDSIDLAIIQGEIGVAENGCVWIPRLMKERIICFIAEYLVILLDKSAIVNNMHEAYGQIDFHNKDFGVFISGPSKTADIEQALVVGAHGAKGVLVILT